MNGRHGLNAIQNEAKSHFDTWASSLFVHTSRTCSCTIALGSSLTPPLVPRPALAGLVVEFE
jgi:hypothetical protein